MKRWLIDTGPFVAYFDDTDPLHKPASASIDAFSGQLVTTGPVITEVMYFLADAPDGPNALAEFVTAAGVQIADATQPLQIHAAVELMSKYRDTPMDFADASLVLLAEELNVTDILTLDRRGFSTYRTSRGMKFRLVLRV